MTHLDLFSGIGGFAYAADQVFGDVEHIFCDNDKFCQQVLKKHWPESDIYNDITAITDTPIEGLQGPGEQQSPGRSWAERRIDLLTGGFPCQPFSAAGLRHGTADERHLWPEMLRVIQLTKPTWVIAENVRGLATWNDGMVLEQICLDLETNGYEVQPFIIPAVAVNAPHRRDRVWFIANRKGDGAQGWNQQHGRAKPDEESIADAGPDWNQDWATLAAELCSVDDGLPAEVGGFKFTKAQHRKEQLKAYGNAIVPQVAVEIMRAMK